MTKLSDLANQQEEKVNEKSESKRLTDHVITNETQERGTPEEFKESTPVELTEEQIALWKKEHGKIFKITFDEQDIVWRRLRRREYIDAINIEGSNEDEAIYLRQNAIAEAVTLYPENIADLIEDIAGLSGQISDQVIAKSGFKKVEAEEL